MNLALFIARRYFFSRKKKNFINIISNISMIGVCVGTMALVIVLSVFNGLEDLFRSLYGTFNSQIQVKAAEGKFFELTPELLSSINSVEGVESVAEVIEDNVVLTYREAQSIVKMRGVSNNFLKQNGLDSVIVAGKLVLQEDGVDYAIMGSGVQFMLSVSLKDDLYPLQIWYPNNTKKTIDLNSPNAIFRKPIRPGAVFAIEQQYDNNYIFVPLSFARDLVQAGNNRTSLEIKTASGIDIRKVQNALKTKLGNQYTVQNRDEQHANLLRAIQFEKLFVYITFSFILAIASFNIFFSLTMLALDKQKDVAVLSAMGASAGFIKRLFITEGAIIAFTGAATGIVLGFVICWLQQTFGFVSMGMQTSVVDAYPVQMRIEDFARVGLTIIVIVFVASYFPAVKASKNIDAKL
ncbi:FtsX-like permease family protein [Rhodocytophaga aerolata]|uniref:FtsX-like permease family protein n=2 Tax=Rhodocytophaga aerolata TaxID=455078 RepID=A0ABT8R2D6_9BACT|nr:FtsX-like permease family protein [Rhodocytophaga aerolata]MDO1444805.1 FtsX-like permease family protein [Rhodocytophaga aerolata]